MSESERPQQHDPTQDESAIRKLVERYTAAWNDHDAQVMTAYANFKSSSTVYDHGQPEMQRPALVRIHSTSTISN